MEGTSGIGIQSRRRVLEIVEKVGRDEMNFAEFPIASLSDRLPANVKTLEFEDEIDDPQADGPVVRKLTVSGSDRYGLPTALDDEVIVGLIQLSRRNNFASPTVQFSRYELIQVLGWKDEGKSYDRIETAINRWCGVSLYWDNAWWDKEVGAWMNEKFGILDNATILDKRYYERKRKAGQMALALSSFKWNEVVYRSFLSGNLKRLDMELFRSLRSSVAKRMYRFLDKRFFHRAKWGFDLHNFAFEKIGLSRSYAGNAAKIREKLGPAIEELEERGYLEPLPISKRYVQVRKGEWQVFFLKRSVATDSEPLAVEELANEWESALTSRGVGHAVASELVAQHGDVVVKEKIEFHDWLLRNKDSRIGKNPAGFLVASIRGNYPLPKGFETEEMRQGKLQKAAEKKRRETEHEKIRAERENAEKEAERRIVDEFMASLGSDEARQSFEEEAVREDSFLRTFYTKAKARGQGEDFKMYRELILRNAIKRRQVEVVV